jgi:hypothetical protein
LARSEHADAARPFLCQRILELLRHHVEGFIPGHRRELAVFVVLAVRLTQQWLREPVVAVHDLRKKISFDAIQPAIDLGKRIAVGRDDPPILGRDHDATARPTKAARRLVPFQLGDGAVGEKILRRQGRRYSACRCSHDSSFPL